jgi:hypothetical protein
MSEKSKLSSGRHVDPQRRKLLKLSAAAGASAIASPWMFQSSRAAPRPVKIGMVSPETGPIAAFGEADQFVLAGVRKALGDGIAIAGESTRSRSSIRTANQIRTVPLKSPHSSSITTR